MTVETILLAGVALTLLAIAIYRLGRISGHREADGHWCEVSGEAVRLAFDKGYRCGHEDGWLDGCKLTTKGRRLQEWA